MVRGYDFTSAAGAAAAVTLSANAAGHVRQSIVVGSAEALSDVMSVDRPGLRGLAKSQSQESAKAGRSDTLTTATIGVSRSSHGTYIGRIVMPLLVIKQSTP